MTSDYFFEWLSISTLVRVNNWTRSWLNKKPMSWMNKVETLLNATQLSWLTFRLQKFKSLRQRHISFLVWANRMKKERRFSIHEGKLEKFKPSPCLDWEGMVSSVANQWKRTRVTGTCKSFMNLDRSLLRSGQMSE